jgi:hypothetical protein
MKVETFYYAFSTIAQCAAALAALIGFFGLWRQDRLRERMSVADHAIDARYQERTKLISMNLWPDRVSPTYREDLSRIEQRLQEARTHHANVQAEQRQLMGVLVRFLIGTLALLALAILGLTFAEELHPWWPMRVFIVMASLWLSSAPAYVVLHAAGRARAVHQCWSHLRYQLRRVCRRGQMWRGSALIVERLRGQWRHVRARLWDSPRQHWSERGWPILQRWKARVRTRIRRP